MPRPRVKIVLRHASTASLDTAQAQVNSDLPAAAKIYDRPFNWVQGRLLGQPIRVLEVRLKAIADADTLRDKLLARVAALRAAGFSGRILYHQCTHDDASVQSCNPQRLVI